MISRILIRILGPPPPHFPSNCFPIIELGPYRIGRDRETEKQRDRETT